MKKEIDTLDFIKIKNVTVKVSTAGLRELTMLMINQT